MVDDITEVACRNCPMYTPKANGSGGWCKIPGDKVKASISNGDSIRGCLTHAKLVLKIDVDKWAREKPL
jgi:hypothetical protein